ncbi:MlaE family lipid ABC transporter permease subunit [bacterium]|nr:MlaE family lipid ABC transporter permease subunit [bacterium]
MRYKVAMKPTLSVEQHGNGLVAGVAGNWVAEFADECHRLIQSFQPRKGQKATIECAGLEALDVTGAWLLQRRVEELAKQGIQVVLQGFAKHHAQFIEQVGQLQDPITSLPTTPYVPLQFTARAVHGLIEGGTKGLEFLGKVLMALGESIVHPSRIRWSAIVKSGEMAAVRAAPIVSLISFLIAIVLAYQGSAQLRRFGAQIFTIDLVSISVLREMGVLLTAIMVAGRSGSAFAAEIGTMKLNQELDALRTMGMSPMDVLVVPRILALTLMMPLLAFLADMMGLTGAAILTVLTSDTSFTLFMSRLLQAMKMTDFWVGMIKAPVFGLIIGLVGCHHGMSVTNSAESVGVETTRAVVTSIFFVIFADALFSILFTKIGI